MRLVLGSVSKPITPYNVQRARGVFASRTLGERRVYFVCAARIQDAYERRFAGYYC